MKQRAHRSERVLAAHRTTPGPQAETKTWLSCYNLHGAVTVSCVSVRPRNASLSLVQVVTDSLVATNASVPGGGVPLHSSSRVLLWAFLRELLVRSRARSQQRRQSNPPTDFPPRRCSPRRRNVANSRHRTAPIYAVNYRFLLRFFFFFLFFFSKRAFSRDARFVARACLNNALVKRGSARDGG